METFGRPIIRATAIGLSGIVGYCTGLFPSADLASRLSGEGDRVRTSGSGNPGATNAAKVLGPIWGAAVLSADVAKGASGAAIGRQIAGKAGASAAGIGAVLGHCAPIGRRGGKGVAVRYGALIVVSPGTVAFELGVAGAIIASTQRTVLAMTASTLASSLGGAVFARRQRSVSGVSGVVLGTLSALIVLTRFLGESSTTPKTRPDPTQDRVRVRLGRDRRDR
jgi:glycerol-3-phosphate acyltransferase PlsY